MVLLRLRHNIPLSFRNRRNFTGCKLFLEEFIQPFHIFLRRHVPIPDLFNLFIDIDIRLGWPECPGSVAVISRGRGGRKLFEDARNARVNAGNGAFRYLDRSGCKAAVHEAVCLNFRGEEEIQELKQVVLDYLNRS